MKKKGFTLVELVITIAIVIILSVVSVPIYRGYVTKAMMSEGYALLGIILSAQKSYYSEYGNFYQFVGANGPWTVNDTVLSIDARGNKYFTYFNSGFKSNKDLKYFFYAEVRKDETFRNITGKSNIALFYDITTGATFTESFS